MKAFMDKDFLLDTDTAKKLYNNRGPVTIVINFHN